MAMGNYTGTPGAHRIDLAVLTALYNQAEATIAFAAANPNTELRTKWFGTKSTPLAVQNQLNALNNYVGLGPVDIESKNQGTLGMSDLASPNRQILLGWWFSLTWFNAGERVQTIIHELAHKALHAKDVKIGEDPCYKYKALELANHPSRYGEALQNAENWGYYVANHRFLMPAAPPLGSVVQRLNQSSGSRCAHDIDPRTVELDGVQSGSSAWTNGTIETKASKARIPAIWASAGTGRHGPNADST